MAVWWLHNRHLHPVGDLVISGQGAFRSVNPPVGIGCFTESQTELLKAIKILFCSLKGIAYSNKVNMGKHYQHGAHMKVYGTAVTKEETCTLLA